MDVSIILLTKNGERYLDEVLDGIVSQRTKYGYQIVVVDSGSSDRTLEILDRYPVRLATIDSTEFNHGETRNLGARLSHPDSRYLVYLTQDAAPASGWLDGLIDPLESDEAAAGTFSRQIPRADCNPSLARLITTQWEQIGTPRRVVKRVTDLDAYRRDRAGQAFFANTSSAIRKGVWASFPFRRVDFAEDSDWADRVLMAGYTLIYEPASAVYHSHNYGLSEQLRQNFDHARGMKQLFDPPGYRRVSLARMVVGAFREWPNDLRYLRRCDSLSWFQKVGHLLYSPWWHLSCNLGTYLGIRYEDLPGWIQGWLSRQGRLRRR